MNNNKVPKFILVILGLIGLLAIPAFIIFMNYLMYAIFTWPLQISDVINFIIEKSNESFWIKILSFLMLMALSIGLYLLKKKLLIIYGSLQAIGGAFIIYNLMDSPLTNSGISNALTLGAGIFLLVSGVENYYKGYKEKKPKIKK